MFGRVSKEDEEEPEGFCSRFYDSSPSCSKTHHSKTHHSKTHHSKTHHSKTHHSKTHHSKTHHGKKVDASATQPAILMTFLSGAAAKLVETHTDEEIVKMCIAKLTKLFRNEEEAQAYS